jgi:lysophospholipase L1-like esterase
LIMCAVLMLAACGGSSDSTPVQPGSPSDPGTPPGQNPPPGDPPPNTEPYVIDYYGDSTIWGWASGTAGARVATPAPAAFADALPSPPQNEVRNEGVSGTTACALLEGSDGVHPEWAEQMQVSDATHVIINHGINDEKVYGVPRYRACLSDLATIARANGKQVIFETPNPVSNDDVKNYVAAMRAVAGEQQPAVPVIDQHAYLTDYLGDRDLAEIVPDGEHPNQETYILKGEYAAQRFDALFPR